MAERKKLTSNAGAPVADNQNVMTAGPRGPMLLQDVWWLVSAALPTRELLFANTARAISGAPCDIQLRHVGNCMKADQAYGKGVADALGISLSDLPNQA